MNWQTKLKTLTSKEKYWILIVTSAVLIFIIGFLIGFFSAPKKKSIVSDGQPCISEFEDKNSLFQEQLINEIDSKRIENHLR